MTRKKTMHNTQCTMNKRAFTLIEILIATAIFATVALIASLVVAQTVTYVTKLRAVRSTANDAARIADQFSTDVRGANADFVVDGKQYKNGVYFVNCGSTNLLPAVQYFDQTSANTLMLVSRDEYNQYIVKTYRIMPTPTYHILAYIEEFGDTSVLTSYNTKDKVCSKSFTSDRTKNSLTKGSGNLVDFTWNVYWRDAAVNPSAQNKISFTVDVKTSDATGAREYEKAFTEIKSTITARGLNI
jgi:prepilin-type N-terminal cleavage/methylation domain-containing protein